MRRRDHQSGFSIVEAVVVVAAIGIIGAAGWFVYQHNRVRPTSAAPNSGQQTTTTQPTQTTPAQNIVKIPELGISITVPDSIKDLTYQTETVTLSNGNQATLARFSTASLTTANASCGPSSSVLGTLEKASGQFPADATAHPLAYGKLVKQFPTFYISGGSANAGTCPAGANTPVTATSDAHDFNSALTSIQSLN